MSKDIRSFFSSHTGPTSKDTQRKKQRKRIYVDSDSDDSSNDETRSNTESASKKLSKYRRKADDVQSDITTSMKSNKDILKTKPSGSALKPIDPSNMFGTKPVKRTFKTSLADNKKMKIQKSTNEDDDEEFDISFSKIDEEIKRFTEQKKAGIKEKNEGLSPCKNKNKSFDEQFKEFKESDSSPSKESHHNSSSNNETTEKKNKSTRESKSKSKKDSPVKVKNKNVSPIKVKNTSEIDKQENKNKNETSVKPSNIAEKLKTATTSIKTPTRTTPIRGKESKYFGSLSDSQGSVQSEESGYASGQFTQSSEEIVSPIHPKDTKKSKEVISSDLWVEKHKPVSSNKIIGQHTPQSNVNKLKNWLINWNKHNLGPGQKKRFTAGTLKDATGSIFKAALLSGPPGVGKTTTVTLVCKELGFDMVEFNASDTRSKKLLQEEVSELLTNKSLTPFFSKGNSIINKKQENKHVLVMDEVDGMAGNEDRGGVQELIQLIKVSKIPIICMCNDRQHPKIRSLVNYCFDLRYSKPRLEQIKGYMMSVCCKEKLKLSGEALNDIIKSSDCDVRLVLNHLSMLASVKNSTDLQTSKKYIKLGPWDVLRKIFTHGERVNMSIHDKFDLFFYDYNIAPLFVHENYLAVDPINSRHMRASKRMELFAKTADSISLGDKVDHIIRKTNNWSLLPTQALFASFIPGEILDGFCTSQINFPSWFGKNSKRTKMDRLLQEIQIHTRLRVSANKESMMLDYMRYLRDKITKPLVELGTNGVKVALETMQQYQLVREDLDSIQELSQWPGFPDPFTDIDSKVKAAFTRTYNREAKMCPYSTAKITKKGHAKVTTDTGFEDEEEESEEENDEEDAMVTVKNKTTKKVVVKPSTSHSQRATKGKGRKIKD